MTKNSLLNSAGVRDEETRLRSFEKQPGRASNCNKGGVEVGEDVFETLWPPAQVHGAEISEFGQSLFLPRQHSAIKQKRGT